MKKIVFSLMTLFALALMAGSANAQTKMTPLAGGTYSYSITYDFGSGGSGSGALTVSNATDLTIQNQIPANLTSLSGSGTITFDIKYADAISGAYWMKLVLTDGGTGACTNQVIKNVTIATAPTLALAVTTTDDNICQLADGTDDNVPASTGKQNTVKYTVTPTTGAGTGYTYSFGFAASPSDFGTYSYAKESGTGTVNPTTGAVTDANGPVSINVTWTTTTGLGEKEMVGTISGSSLKTSVAEGGITVTGTESTPTASVTIHSTPTIGSFN